MEKIINKNFDKFNFVDEIYDSVIALYNSIVKFEKIKTEGNEKNSVLLQLVCDYFIISYILKDNDDKIEFHVSVNLKYNSSFLLGNITTLNNILQNVKSFSCYFSDKNNFFVGKLAEEAQVESIMSGYDFKKCPICDGFFYSCEIEENNNCQYCNNNKNLKWN